MSDNVTEIKPPQASVAADQEPVSDVKTFRVLKWADHPDSDENEVWLEVGTLEAEWRPSPTEVGEAYGEGDYLIFEEHERAPAWVYPMRIVADRVYRLAEDEA